MKKHRTSRKAAFKAALALAETNAQAWAAEHGVTVTHLNYVLSGERESKTLTDTIDGFIAKYLPQHAKLAA